MSLTKAQVLAKKSKALKVAGNDFSAVNAAAREQIKKLKLGKLGD